MGTGAILCGADRRSIPSQPCLRLTPCNQGPRQRLPRMAHRSSASSSPGEMTRPHGAASTTRWLRRTGALLRSTGPKERQSWWSI